LQWSNYDGKVIRLRPRKSITKRKPRGVTVTVPVAEPLKRALDEMAKHKKGFFILLNSDNQPWTEAGFRSSFGKARDRAGLFGLRFNDTRGTAVTRLAMCGVEVPEIATLRHPRRALFEPRSGAGVDGYPETGNRDGEMDRKWNK